MSILLGPLRCLRARVVITWRGPWIADCDIDPDGATVTLADVPIGAQVISVTTGSGVVVTLNGTVDPKGSGRWVAGVPVRIIAGGGGWDETVESQDFQSPAGVSALTVEQATAAEVGETVNDPQPSSLGLHWVRMAGPAMRIFTCPDRDWYVDVAGVTQVGTWPAAQPDSTVEILDWDPIQQRATLSADALVLPGTVLVDPRFDGPITVRDVEIAFDAEGTRITAWCSSVAIPRLVSALTNMVREFGGIAALKSYEYRVVTQSGAMLDLQQVDNADGTLSAAPPLKNVLVWPGMQGLSAEYLSSSHCRVIFLGQNYSQPLVVSFDGQLPTEVTIDASGIIHVGPSGTVKIAENASDYAAAPLARVGDPITLFLPPLCPLSGSLNGVPIPPGTLFLEVAFPLPGVIQGGASKGLA